jgi:hypothetical protein
MFSRFRFKSLKYQKGTFCKTPSHFPNESFFTFDAVEVTIKSGSGKAHPSTQRFPDSLRRAAIREFSCRLETKRPHAANMRPSCGFRGWLGATITLAGYARTDLFECRSFGFNSIQNTTGLDLKYVNMWD